MVNLVELVIKIGIFYVLTPVEIKKVNLESRLDYLLKERQI